MQTLTLGELEKQVMDIVWDKKGCSARDILMQFEHERKLAYTTIATILQRLFDKGLLNRKKAKLGYTYSPKITKEKYSKTIAQSFLKKFIDSYGDTAIASFAKSVDSLPAKKRNYFLKLLEANVKNK